MTLYGRVGLVLMKPLACAFWCLKINMPNSHKLDKMVCNSTLILKMRCGKSTKKDGLVACPHISNKSTISAYPSGFISQQTVGIFTMYFKEMTKIAENALQMTEPN